MPWSMGSRSSGWLQFTGCWRCHPRAPPRRRGSYRGWQRGGSGRCWSGGPYHNPWSRRQRAGGRKELVWERWACIRQPSCRSCPRSEDLILWRSRQISANCGLGRKPGPRNVCVRFQRRAPGHSKVGCTKYVYFKLSAFDKSFVQQYHTVLTDLWAGYIHHVTRHSKCHLFYTTRVLGL